MNYKNTVLPIIGIIICFWLIHPSFTSYAEPELEYHAISIIADRNGIPRERLRVGKSAEARFQEQDISVVNFKIEDIERGDLFPIALFPDRTEVSMDDLRERERQLYLSLYGKLEKDLAQLLERVPPDEGLSVIVRLKRTAEVRLEKPSPDAEIEQAEVSEIYRELDGQRAQTASIVTGPFVQRLGGMSIEARADELAPVVYARIRSDQIREIAGLEEVDVVSLAGRYEPSLTTARKTNRADLVHATGNTGQGVQVAQIEVGGQVEQSNPFIGNVVQDTFLVCGAPDWHATGVAGIISGFSGIAPGAHLFSGGSCRGKYGELFYSSNTAMTWGARALNLSFGGSLWSNIDSGSQYYDEVVIEGWRTVIASAGNDATNPYDSGVDSPANGFNVIAVGNYDDRNTTNLGDDMITPFSSFVDQVLRHGDREKPEVSAPGENITTASTLPPFWLGYTNSGTSFSAPMVTGTSALMMKANASLSFWPEAVRSILMATAVHNIEGDPRLSEMDGAGGIDSKRATDVAANISGKWGGKSYSCSEPNSLDIDTFFITQGSTVRAVVAWDQSMAGYWYDYAAEPLADLDIQVIDQNQRVVASSMSFDNTYEIVLFNAPVTGVYKLRVKKFRCNQTPKWIGWAWHVI